MGFDQTAGRARRRPDDLCPSRRAVLRGLAGLVLAPGVLVACTTGSDDSTAGGTSGGGDASSGAGPGAAGEGGTGRQGTVPVSDVEVGAARVVDVGGRPVVVAQPAEGTFLAFSAACTHQGTTVVAEEGLVLRCPNHGSRFDATDGSVQNGPATAPLQSVPVVVQGDDLLIG